jgi:hypothetical protein
MRSYIFIIIVCCILVLLGEIQIHRTVDKMAEFVEPSDPIRDRVEQTLALGLDIANNDDGWVKTWEKKGIVAYQQDSTDGKVCIKGRATFESPPMDVFEVIQHKTTLDPDMRQHDVILRIAPDICVEHIFFNVPWPVTPRDGLGMYFFRLLSDGVIALLSFGHEDHSLCPPLDGHVRSELTIAGFVLKPTIEGGTECTYMLKVHHICISGP